MHWFTSNAPIRLKLLICFSFMTGLTAIAAVAGTFGPTYALTVGGAATLVAAIAGAWFRHSISTPYVTTVVRMEGLAAGDLKSPIEYTDFKDCVGRMTVAMRTFRDTAEAQGRASEEQKLVVDTFAAKLKRLSEGDLTADLSEDLPGEYALLKDNYNAALTALRELIGSVTESANSIRGGSGEILQASEDLARRTESNAASLEETAASLTEVDRRVKATAEAAKQTVARADQATATVGSGRTVVESAVSAMERVAENAQDIDAVIEGLDKIAFQTRVLAMNAAVEAGRAGEAGRGFAVVADLVSALAMRAEEESKNAREQLTVTQTGIATAVEAVQKVDGALSEISSGVADVHTLLGSMAKDNEAQSLSLSQISSAVGDMDKATQQNAAMVEQTSAAARSLSSEVDTLADQANHFNVGQARAPRDAARRPTATRSTPQVSQPSRTVPAGVIANGKANGAAHSGDWAEF